MKMTGDYAVDLWVRDAPMDREAVRFHLSKDNHALSRNPEFVADLATAARQHPDVFGSFEELAADGDDEIEICPHCGTEMYE